MLQGEGCSERLHASAVSYEGRAVLIVGPSGAGKSSLALQLMAFGARLVSDDAVIVTVKDGVLMASAPRTIEGQIEARGIGILGAAFEREAAVSLVVDMGVAEEQRLPELSHRTILGCDIPIVHKSENTAFAAAILQYLRGGRVA